MTELEMPDVKARRPAGCLSMTYRVTCGCCECAGLNLQATTWPGAAKEARTWGWKQTAKRGWVCPTCIRTGRYLEER